jgi:TPR repeat protein
MNARTLFALALIAAAPAAVAKPSVKAGVEAWQRSDYTAAVASWRPLAEKGDPDASFNLGQAYRLGRGVPTNLAAAQTWFERAANKGHLDAQTTLGLLLFQNGSRAQGLKWLKAAAEKGEPRASLVYGTALVNGDGVTQDPVLGYAYVSRSAAQGLGPAQETLKQLDQLLPAEDRKKGAAIALSNARSAPPPKSRPATSAAPSKIAAAAKPPPAPKPATQAPAPVPESGAWRIQLGAFSQRGSAEALYKKLSGNSALAGRNAFYVPAGAVTRLQVGPFISRAAAQSACNAVRPQPCFPAAAK